MKAPNPDLRIVGDNVYLRPITIEDTGKVLKWRNAPRTVNNFYYRKPISVEEHTDWINNKVNKGLVHQFIVCLKESNEEIGVVYLQKYEEVGNRMESGVFMSEDAPAGKGIGTEAVKLMVEEYGFKILGLHKMIAHVIATNTASRRLHEKAGFKEEGFLKDDAFIEGGYVDTVCYGIINPEC